LKNPPNYFGPLFLLHPFERSRTFRQVRELAGFQVYLFTFKEENLVDFRLVSETVFTSKRMGGAPEYLEFNQFLIRLKRSIKRLSEERK
jgi:hypothetical protein